MTKEILFSAIASSVIAYLLGSLSFAVIISRCFYKKDIRKFGSGNAGMTNILRTFGKKAAAFTLIGDMGKGVAAVLIAKAIFLYFADSVPVYGAYLAAFFATLGHLYPIYFKFKGGKGVAVAAGTVLATEPMVFVALAVVFLIMIALTKIVSLSSIAVATLYPVFTFLYSYFFVPERSAMLCTLFSGLLGALIIWMHHENIKRLANGTEYKFGQKKQ